MFDNSLYGQAFGTSQTLSLRKDDVCSCVGRLPDWALLSPCTLPVMMRERPCIQQVVTVPRNFCVESRPYLELPVERERSGLCSFEEEKLALSDRKTRDKTYICSRVFGEPCSHPGLGAIF